jgi:hypothetical protein
MNYRDKELLNNGEFITAIAHGNATSLDPDLHGKLELMYPPPAATAGARTAAPRARCPATARKRRTDPVSSTAESTWNKLLSPFVVPTSTQITSVVVDTEAEEPRRRYPPRGVGG